MSLTFQSRAASVGLALVLAAGCTGSVLEADSGQSPRTPSPAVPSDPFDPTSPTVVPPPTQAVPLPSGSCGAPAPATLLTREQYINAVSDLVGLDVRPFVVFKDASGRKPRPGATLSPLQAEGYLQTAVAIADQATSPANLGKLLPCDPAADEAGCADKFIEKFASRALRRPLRDDFRADLREVYQQGRSAGGFATGIKWVIDGVLQTPDFLYHLVLPAAGGKPGDVVSLNDFEIADRLAGFLWNSAPDEELWRAAAQGQLNTAAQIEVQVSRMRASPRAQRTRADFYRGWLNLDLLAAVLREDPAFTPALAQSLEKSILAGIDDLYGPGGDGKAQTLFSSPAVVTDDVITRLYGAGAGGAAQRRGLLTHPALMTILAETNGSDPIRRGLFVFKKLLCQDVPEPPDGVPDLPPLQSNLTTRQRLVAHRDAPQCRACHAAFEPMGLAFENFDHLGRFRTQENGIKVDSSAEINDAGLDLQGSYPDGFAFLDKVASSSAARNCIAQQWYEYGVSRDVAEADKCALASIKSGFVASGDLNQLMASIALGDTFRNRLVTQE